MRRASRLVVSFVGFALMILGLPSIAEDVSGWGSWLDWLDADWSWLVVLLGVLIILAANVPQLIGLRPAVQVPARSRNAAPATVSDAGHERYPAAQPDDARPSPSGEVPASAPDNAASTPARTPNVVSGGVLAVQGFREAFDTYIETFLERRREARQGMSDERMEEVRAEYGELHRSVVRTYRAVRDQFRAFVRDEPLYDLRDAIYGESGYYNPSAWPVDKPLTSWWDHLTFDASIAGWSNADDDHMRGFLIQQRAVLDAFAEWVEETVRREIPGEISATPELRAALQEAREARDTAARESRATLSGRQGSISGGASADTYTFELMNTGPAAARDVRAWATQDGAAVGAAVELHTLPPDMRWYELRLEIPREPSRSGGLNLIASFRDDSGEREERLLEIRPLR